MTRVLAMVLLVATVAVAGNEFLDPVRLEADGKPIDTDVGHAAPFVADFDGDGVRDLLVGQFGEGILWIYRNTGTDQKPVLAPRVKFDGTVPTG